MKKNKTVTLKKRKINTKFTQGIILKNKKQKDYLDTLYILENDLADNRITEKEFEDNVNFIKSIYEGDI